MLPRIIHRVWIGSKPDTQQMLTLLAARAHILGNVSIILWTNQPVNTVFTFKNIVVRKVDDIWKEAVHEHLPLNCLRAIFERETHGYFHNYASASDVIRLIILYLYGGIYLDMDVSFKDGVFNIFEDSDGIDQKLGVLGCDDGIGNGVLISMPRTFAVRSCLIEIADLYSKGLSGKISWGIKRYFGDVRVHFTSMMSGPKMIYKKLNSEGLLIPVIELFYFKKIDSSGRAFSTPPLFKRSDSLP